MLQSLRENSLLKLWAIVLATFLVGCDDDKGVVDSQPVDCSPGIEWTKVVGGELPTGFTDVVWTGEMFVAVGVDVVMTSTDGQAWNEVQSASMMIDVGLAVAWSGKELVAVGDNILRSLDGVNWVEIDNLVGLIDVVWADTQFVAVGYSEKILTSPDGITWTDQNAGLTSPATLQCVAWSGQEYAVFGTGNVLLRSADGIAWTSGASPLMVCHDLIWGDTMFIAVSSAGAIYTSPNGTSWQEQDSETTEDLWGVAWTTGLYVAVGGTPITGDVGEIVTSPDGIVWTSRFSGTVQLLTDIAGASELCTLVAVGFTNTVLVSTD